MQETNNKKCHYRKELWDGQSRDGKLIDGEGFHYFKMNDEGQILEAFEFYESLDGENVVSPVPEFENVNWFKDLGYEDLEVLEDIEFAEYNRLIQFKSS